MGRLIEWLLQNPLIALVIVIWLVGAIGRGLGKTAAARRSPPEPGPSRRVGGEPPVGMEPPVVQPAERRTQEEVAAEMRRILGMEPAPPRTAPPPPPRREARSPEKPPQPLQPRTLGQLAVHVDPHVGEKIRGLKAPASGAVGRSELGQLGGRGRERQRRAFRHGASVVDLDHLTRAIVMREILDPPLALRPSFDRPA